MKYFIVLLFAVSALAMPDPDVTKEAFFDDDDEFIAEETAVPDPGDSDIQAKDAPIETESLTTRLNAIDAKLADQPCKFHLMCTIIFKTFLSYSN